LGPKICRKNPSVEETPRKKRRVLKRPNTFTKTSLCQKVEEQEYKENATPPFYYKKQEPPVFIYGKNPSGGGPPKRQIF